MASDTLEKIDRARVVVAELNYGKREWKGLHEPASEDATDVVIMEALRCAALEISRLTRELEKARELIRDLVDDEDAGLVWLGRRLVCAYCTADGLYSVDHAADCPIIRARHAIAALRSEAQGEEV